MQFGDDERAAAIQVGAVLLFGMLIISMATYQATVVPDQNKGVEFNHNQKVQGQMQDLRNSVVSVPSGDGGSSVTVDLGTTYPSRTLFVNPGPAYGSLRTVGTDNESVNISVENATVPNTDDATYDVWNGTEREFGTGAVVYRPNYNEYDNAPTTIYEHSLLYNQFRNANLTVSDQRLVNGRTISLVTVDGNLSENGMGSASVTAEPVSASSNSITVEGDGAPINITVPTRLGNDTWREALAEEIDKGNVVGMSHESGPGEYTLLTISLNESRTYDLQMAKVGLGPGVDDEPSDPYVVDVAGDGETVSPDENQTLVAEVRDEYNNPVSGRDVNASVSGSAGGTVTPTVGTTGSDGRVAFTYDPDSTGTATIEANISASGGDRKRVEFEVQVSSSGGGGGGPYTIAYNRTDIDAADGTVNCYDANETCVYDVNADGDNTFTLFAETTPPITGADVDFAHNGSVAVNRIANEDAETDENGEAIADLEATGTPGDAEVYVSTPVDSASLIVKVIGTLAELDVTFLESSNSELRALDNDGNRTVGFDSGQREAMGPARVDFDGDGLTEVPVVNSSNGLELIDRNNETTGVLTSGVAATGVTTGTWQGSPMSIFYPSSDDGDLYRVESDGTTSRIASFKKDVKAVGGIGDFDDDGNDEIAVVLGGPRLGIVDDDGTTYETNLDIGSNNNFGIGEPADFNGDGAVRVPVVSSNNDLTLVSCTKKKNKFDCTQTSLNGGGNVASKTVVAQQDWTGNGQPEIVFANSNDNNNLYYAEVSGDSVSITRIGSGIPITPAGGVR